MKGPQGVLPVLVGVAVGDDGDDGARDGVAAQGDLRRVPRAEALAPREREARDALQQRALAGGLAADDDNLGTWSVLGAVLFLFGFGVSLPAKWGCRHRSRGACLASRGRCGCRGHRSALS